MRLGCHEAVHAPCAKWSSECRASCVEPFATLHMEALLPCPLRGTWAVSGFSRLKLIKKMLVDAAKSLGANNGLLVDMGGRQRLDSPHRFMN